MPGYLLHQGALVLCKHAGQTRPITTDLRVRVSGQPIVTQAHLHQVSGCTLSSGPCLTAQWITAATRVRASGVPVLLADSQAVCTPTATGVQIISTQTRAKGA
jgi:hypothetical protein